MAKARPSPPSRTLQSAFSVWWQHPHTWGRLAEQFARLYYLFKGYRPIRFHGKHPSRPLPVQIDLLLRRRNTLLLVEVKYRRDHLRQPYAVHPAQQKRILSVAHLLAARLAWPQRVQVDVALVSPHWPFIRIIPHAFSAV